MSCPLQDRRRALAFDTTPARGKHRGPDGVQKTMKGQGWVVMVGAKSAVSGIAEGATGIAGGVKQRLRKGSRCPRTRPWLGTTDSARYGLVCLTRHCLSNEDAGSGNLPA